MVLFHLLITAFKTLLTFFNKWIDSCSKVLPQNFLTSSIPNKQISFMLTHPKEKNNTTSRWLWLKALQWLHAHPSPICALHLQNKSNNMKGKGTNTVVQEMRNRCFLLIWGNMSARLHRLRYNCLTNSNFHFCNENININGFTRSYELKEIYFTYFNKICHPSLKACIPSVIFMSIICNYANPSYNRKYFDLPTTHQYILPHNMEYIICSIETTTDYKMIFK